MIFSDHPFRPLVWPDGKLRSFACGTCGREDVHTETDSRPVISEGWPYDDQRSQKEREAVAAEFLASLRRGVN